MPDSNLKSKFFGTLDRSFRAEGPPKTPQNEGYSIRRADWQERVTKRPIEAAQRGALAEERIARGLKPGDPNPSYAELDAEWTTPSISQSDIKHIQRNEREQSWQGPEGVYHVSPKERKSPNSFITQEMPPSHRRWLEQELNRPGSEFNRNLKLDRKKTGRYTSGQRTRLNAYTDSLQQGMSHEEAHKRVSNIADKTGVGRRPSTTLTQRQRQAKAVTGRPAPSGRETKYKSFAPVANEFKLGTQAMAVPARSAIKKMGAEFENMTEQQLIRVQQAAAENITTDMMINEKWAHEQRRAALLGRNTKGKLKGAPTPDKITIFTTNLGVPAVTVPSDSLIGQYIIKKRKSVLGAFGMPARELKGQFPEVARDYHIVDIATGASLGVEGRGGVFNTTGYRFGKKASTGYGKPRALGSHVLYDSATGRPLYDAHGNIRYGEGLTRPVDWSTPNVGFRVLIG